MIFKIVPLRKFYGGKSKMSRTIISLFPKNYENMNYVEPFAGALNVFFKKKPSKAESVSDINKNLYNLYKVLRDNEELLFNKIKKTMYCEGTYYDAIKIYDSKDYEDEIKKAWATLIIFNMAFSGKAKSGYGYNINLNYGSRNIPLQFKDVKGLIHSFSERLENVQIFNRDAHWFLDRFKDESNGLLYLDPPYPGTDQGHYKGFTYNDFNNILEKLYDAKFKFLLSFYEKEGMNLRPFENNDKFVIIKKPLRQSAGSTKHKKMVYETILLNYKSFNCF